VRIDFPTLFLNGSREDEPGVKAIRSCVHKQRALNTWLSSGTSAGTFACPAGPYRNCRGEAGTKNEPKWYFVQIQKKGWKINPHVSNLKSRWFLFRAVQVHPWRWGWVLLEQMRILRGIQLTTHFIDFFVVETKRIISRTVNVISTRQTCGKARAGLRKANAKR